MLGLFKLNMSVPTQLNAYILHLADTEYTAFGLFLQKFALSDTSYTSTQGECLSCEVPRVLVFDKLEICLS